MDPDRRTLHGLGLAATAPRLLVLRSLRQQDRARSAGEIYADVQNAGGKLGLTTVYRTLITLSEAKLVHTFERGGETVYRLCGEGNHRHLVCRRCGLVIEAGDLDRALHRLPAAVGFHVEEIYGVCTSCWTDETEPSTAMR
ncbi:Fur family transcriptional regulator [Microbispora sp. CA-102843]|uniref:Fur family transcriptional regulator n=1 Tax=Microbispora sp. CA-102843 TaxID=3239952 RepID=UPI003D9424AF